MNDFKRLGYPVAIIFISALLFKLMNMYLSKDVLILNVMSILTASALFLFGLSLNKNRRRRSSAVFTKVVAILIVIFLLLMQLGIFSFDIVNDVLFFFGVNSFFINMIYIFCGYLFVD